MRVGTVTPVRSDLDHESGFRLTKGTVERPLPIRDFGEALARQRQKQIAIIPFFLRAGRCSLTQSARYSWPSGAEAE